MLTLRIDDTLCPLVEESIEMPKFNADRLRDVASWREGSQLRVGVRSTPDTDRLLSYGGDIYRVQSFNSTYHHAVLEADGVILYEGVATLEGVEREEGEMLYRLLIRRGGEEWAESAARTRLNDTPISSPCTMTPSGIARSWQGGSAVCFLPLNRDSYPEVADKGLYVTQRGLMPHDYYPFISVKAVLDKVAADSGYTLNSDFLNSDLASRLMFSGAYRSIESSQAYATMGFKALRSKSTTAAAGEDGRVYAWEPQFASNIGALVDTVSALTIDEDGRQLTDAFSAGGCFTFTEGRPCFTPKREISVAFDIKLKYRTAFQLLSSKLLVGFDRIHLGNGCDLKLTLQNPYIDQRAAITGGVSYRLFIFEYDPTASYSLEGYGAVQGGSSLVTFPNGFSGATRLLYKPRGASDYRVFNGDWAIYDGYVSGSGERDVEITVRTPFEQCSPSSPKMFNDIYFGGASVGQQMTLLSGCSIEPIFSGAVGYGESLDFPDVANLNISQAELIDTIAHMFNLRIYTHHATKQIFIEPYDDFYNTELHDWQWRQLPDYNHYREGAVDCSEFTVLGYLPPDGVTLRCTPSNEQMGHWSYHLESYAAKQGSDTRLNPLFMPTISLSDIYSTAPSAEVLTVGDRDSSEQVDSIEPRVVIYYGVRMLPRDEVWPSPSGYSYYPKAAFHSADEQYTLCFEDRDGCEGLHRFYDTELIERAERGVLRCNIYLPPADYVALFDVEGRGATIRSRFRLSVGEHSSQFRLESIESYDPENYIATCTFQRLLND